jgi:glycosyltransferase involved in cell wall biosynthesis
MPMQAHSERGLVVVPAYNEEHTVAEVVRAVRRDAPAWDVLVIDDGSTDETAVIAEEAGASVLHHPFNLGIGGAVQSGFRYAREGDYDRMVQVDADGQHDPREIRRLIAAHQAEPDVDMVCGSRFLSEDYRYPAPISRRTGIHLFAFLLSRIVGQRISDPTSGFRLYNRRAIELFARDYPHDYPEVEAVLMLHHHRLVMREVPVRMYERGGGQSSIRSGKSIYYMIKVLLAIGVGLVRRRPAVVSGEPAAVSAAGAGI